MKVIIQMLLWIFLPVCLIGRIIETSQFEEIIPHLVSEKVLVVCDIDNTLLKSKSHFGGVAWGEHLIRQLKAQGLSYKEVLDIESSIWMAVQDYLEVETIDPNMPYVLEQILQCNNLIIALTARCHDQADFTHGQLSSLGVSLSRDALSSHAWTIEDAHVLYEHGILFATSKIKKSKALFAFLDHHDITPECIVFIDDKLHHVEDMMHACHARGISYVGLRFNGADQHLENFDPVLAQKEWESIDDETIRDLRIHVQKILETKE